MFARFDENLAMTLQDIKETKRYGRTKFAGGIISVSKMFMAGFRDIFYDFQPLA